MSKHTFPRQYTAQLSSASMARAVERADRRYGGLTPTHGVGAKSENLEKRSPIDESTVTRGSRGLRSPRTAYRVTGSLPSEWLWLSWKDSSRPRMMGCKPPRGGSERAVRWLLVGMFVRGSITEHLTRRMGGILCDTPRMIRRMMP